jgi:hypothetical protein
MAWTTRQERSAGRKMRGYQRGAMRERDGLRARAMCLRVR